jgi:hypothetical protein
MRLIIPIHPSFLPAIHRTLFCFAGSGNRGTEADRMSSRSSAPTTIAFGLTQERKQGGA